VEREQLTFGNGGWARYRRSDWPAVVYLQLVDRDGRLQPAGLFIEPVGEVMSTDLLREVPLGRIEAWANSEGDRVRARLAEPGPDLRRAARSFTRRYLGAKHWLADMQRAQVPGTGTRQAPLHELGEVEPVEPPDLGATLDVPAAKPYPDRFYQEVAETFRRLAPWHRSPATVIAEDNAVPPSTSHRWVKIARQKGFLEPGRRGKGS
jgi:hypothetical protein